MPAAGTARYHHPSDRAVLAADGLDDLDELFTRFWPAQTRHVGRHVARATLGSNDVVFVKMQTKRPRLIPTMRDMRDGRFFRSQPENEWHGLHLLRAAGLHAAQPLALYRRGWRHFRAAVVIRAVPPEKSLHDLVADGTWTTVSPTDRRAIMQTAGEVVERIHQAGLAWAGVAAKHLYPEQTPDGSWRHWLIDCEGVHRDPRGRQLDRDRKKLRQSVQRSGADEEALGWLGAA